MRLTYKLEKPIDTKYLHYVYMAISDYDISRGNYGRIADWEIYNKLGQYEDIDTDPTHLAKIKQALEIIKTKLLAGCFSEEDSYSNYAMAIIMSGNETLKKNMMTEQEYNLVKEVLEK